MKAVNLIPADARRGRAVSRNGGGGPKLQLDTFGPAQFVVLFGLIVVALILLRVLADNSVNNRQATLAAVKTRVQTEEAQASSLKVYVTFVQAAQERESQVRSIAEQRFPWKHTLDQISHVLPLTTSLTSLTASTVASTTAPTTTTSTGAAVGGPTFTLAGCAATANQDGVATLLRRLTVLSGVTNVGFQSSTRQVNCGNSFNLGLTFAAPGTSTPTTGSASTSAVPGAATTTTTTATSGTTTG